RERASSIAVHSAGGAAMNELAIRILWLAAQATFLSVVAAVLCAVAARRRPGAGAGVALTGLVGLILLTTLAVLPLPEWWSWSTFLGGRHFAVEETGVLSTEYSVLTTPLHGLVGKDPDALNETNELD